jgi:hypothetical protein
MKLSIRHLVVPAFLLFAGCSNRQSQITLYDLRVENLTEPAGIGTTVPGLSWKIRSWTNGTAQKACELLIARELIF